ncbi:retrovirus-related Pol polyprotein from transposon 17.6 [Trichonephila clavipes]|nr:retrovirus-related Pol polyprotein from transposon 17.6 [Trichonephila clavipes]
MERVIHRSLMNWLIENKKLHFYQTAFRTHHSTTDQLFYLNQSIIDGFQEKPHKKTFAVFLDILAVFDKVWRQKLVHTIQSTGINGKALLWINDFLRGRKFSVRFNGALSESHRMWAGVPQGSVLSSLLFLIFMNTIHHHIRPDTNIACYADDIARILTITRRQKNYCIFSTDRRHRSSFNANINIQNSQIKKVDLPTYLGVTLDPELRFSKHIKQIANKALGKLNFLRKLSGTSWGSRPQTLKSTICTVIRPVLEYATPIWTPASISVKRKLDSVQHRAAKIIIGAVSSTNNEKAEQECVLPPLECRRKLATIKFTNKLRSYGLDHISRRVFDKWKHSTRLKRSSTLQLDCEIRKELYLDHSSLEFLQEPFIPKNPPKNTCFELELLQPCSKKEDLVALRQKGLETIAILSQDNFTISYTDGSSDRSLSNGGAGIILLLPDGKWSNDEKVTILKLKLAGIAEEFFLSDPTHSQLTEYNDIARILIKRFEKAVPLSTHLQLFSSCIQGSSESVQEFAARINKLGTQIFQSGNSAQNTAVKNANDQLLQSRFISGLRNDIRRFVLSRDPLNLDESISAVLIVEQNMKLNQIANDKRSALSPAQTENSVLSALTDKLEEINLRVGRLQKASSVTARKTGLDSKLKNRLFQLLISHKSAFARSTVELSAAATEHHRISLQHGYPIKCPIYKIPFNLKNEFRRQITDLEKAGIISKYNSQYDTPALFVKQKEKWCLVLDFRKLNEITLTQDFVILTLDDILHEISGSNYFSALDMKSAFNQIPLHFAERHKTAFSTPDGDKYEFNRLCFGLKNSPKAFQSIAQEVLGDLLHNGALVYIDDIILFTKTIDEHFELLSKVLNALKEFT